MFCALKSLQHVNLYRSLMHTPRQNQDFELLFFFNFQTRQIIILERYSLKSQWDYIAASEDWVIKQGLGWVFKELITAFWCWKRILIISNSLSASQDFTQLEVGLSASFSHGAWSEEGSHGWFLGGSVASHPQREMSTQGGNLGLKGTTKIRGSANGCKVSLVNYTFGMGIFMS